MTKRRHVPQSSEWGRAVKQLMADTKDLKTQTALAKKAGVSQSTVGRIIRGDVNPQSDSLQRIAVALGMTLKTKHVEVDAHGESRVLRFAVETLDRVADQLDEARNQLRRLRKEGHV